MPIVNQTLPNPPLTMSLSATFTHILNTSRDDDIDTTTFLGSLFQRFMTLSVNKCFLIFNLNLPWCNLRPFLPCLDCDWGEDTNPHPTRISFQVERDEVSSYLAILQAKQPQHPQLLLIWFVFQTLPQLCCFSLDMLLL